MPRRKEVDAWLSRYENPMKDVVQRMREIILAADPRMDECIKWQAPTFTFEGNLASFFPKSKQHASLMFHQGAKIPGVHPRLEGGAGTGKVMKIGSVAEANAARRDLEKIVRAWCELRASSSSAPKPATTKKSAKKRATPARAAGEKKVAKRRASR